MLKVPENPCLCIPLRIGVLVIAGIDIILAMVPLLAFSFEAIPWSNNFQLVESSIENVTYNPEHGDFTSTHTTTTIVPGKDIYFDAGIWTVIIFFLTIDIGISCMLISGARTLNPKRCKAWFYIRTVLFLCTSITILAVLCLRLSVRFVAYDIVFILYRAFCLVAVYRYIGDILSMQIPHSHKELKTTGNNTTTDAHPSVIIVSEPEPCKQEGIDNPGFTS